MDGTRIKITTVYNSQTHGVVIIGTANVDSDGNNFTTYSLRQNGNSYCQDYSNGVAGEIVPLEVDFNNLEILLKGTR